jgi:hypothetical protein
MVEVFNKIVSSYISNETCYFLSRIVLGVRTDKATLQFTHTYMLHTKTNVIARNSFCKTITILDKQERGPTVEISTRFE